MSDEEKSLNHLLTSFRECEGRQLQGKSQLYDTYKLLFSVLKL